MKISLGCSVLQGSECNFGFRVQGLAMWLLDEAWEVGRFAGEHFI